MPADRTSELANVLAEYTDEVIRENQSAFLQRLATIQYETRRFESSTSTECNAPSSNKHTTTPNPNKHAKSLQLQNVTLPDPGHRSTILIDTPIPMEDGMVDTLWDFVREHGFEVLRQDEVGHLLELLKYYVRIMTRADGPTPYRISITT